jgi:hypothetical protein
VRQKRTAERLQAHEVTVAQFKYLGEIPRLFVAEYGPTTRIAVPQKDAEPIILEDLDGWQPDTILPLDFTDPISLLCLRADPRFEEVG